MDPHDEFIGIEDVYAAIVTKDDSDGYLADTPVPFAPTAEITGAPAIENKTTYYNNKPKNNFVSEGETPLTIVVSGLSAAEMALYLGKTYDESTGRVYDEGKPTPPYVALSFSVNKGQDGLRYYQFLKGTFSGGAEEAKTMEKGIEVKTYTLTYTAVTTTHQFDVNGEMMSLKRIFADTTDSKFEPGDWFGAVQTPATAVAAVAFAIESSVPADNATGIAVDSVITLTLNNKSIIQSVSLFQSDLTPVASTVSVDMTGKIITITPDADLAAATDHMLIIAGITDVFGQTIKDQVIEFTTA